jgi:hypothetical protein
VSVLERRIEALERSFDTTAPVKDSEERRRIIEELEARRPEFEERMAREEAEGNFRRRRAGSWRTGTPAAREVLRRVRYVSGLQRRLQSRS